MKRMELQKAEAEVATALFKTMQELRADAANDGNILDGYPNTHPSKLVQNYGMGIFGDMIDECDTLSYSVANLNLAVIAPGIEILPAEGGGTAEEMAAEFQRKDLDHMRGTISQVLYNIQSKSYNGFSIQEPYFDDPIVGGDFAGKRFHKAIISKGVKYIGFKTNDFNDIEGDGVWQENYDASSGQYLKVSLDDVVYHVHMPRDNDPHGVSLLLPAYPWFILWKMTRKAMGRFIEHYGIPWPIVRVEDEEFARLQNDPTSMANLKTFLKDTIKSGFAVFSNAQNLEYNQPGAMGERGTVFDTVLKFSERGMSRSCWIPALMGEDSEHSTRASTTVQTVTQFERFLRFEGDGLMDVYNQQVIKRSHNLNYGERVGCPVMRLKPYSSDDMLIQAQILQILAGKETDIRLPLSKEAVYERFNFTPPTDDEDSIGGGPTQSFPLPKDAPPEAQEQARKAAYNFTHEFYEMLERHRDGKKHPAERMYNFPTNGNGGGRLADLFQTTDAAADAVEATADFSKADVEEDKDADVWETYAGGTLEEIAEAVENSAPKS